MSIDFYTNATWKVIESTTDVKKGQRIQIQHKPGGGENDLEFAVPKAPPHGVKGFGDQKWGKVYGLHYAKGTAELGVVIGYAEVTRDGETRLNQIGIRGGEESGRKFIICDITPLDSSSLSAARRNFVEVYRQLRSMEDEEAIPGSALSRIVRRLRRVGVVFEELGEWEAEDDGG